VATDDAGNVLPTGIPCGLPLVQGSEPICYGAQDLQSAYAIPALDSTATIGIVDAFDDPNAESDLAVYRATYGLPPCTTANGCFTKVGESGSTTALPATDTTGWAVEISLDVQMASAACPTCKILLVEASSATLEDLSASVNTAVSLGATVVSNSYGGGESSTQTGFDGAYHHPGVGIFASSGDGAFGVEYPAASPFVTAVGGTSLLPAPSTSRGWSESVWDLEVFAAVRQGPGSGCSQFEPKPVWQRDTGCAARTVADVSAVADPSTGVAVFESFEIGGWAVIGGTSVASPLVASIYALTGNGAADGAFSYRAWPTAFHDVTVGDNSSLVGCSPAYLCTAQVGYDGPTGNGTPNASVLAQMAAATPRNVPWNHRPDFDGDGRADTITTSAGIAFVHYGSDLGIERAAGTTLANYWPGSATLCGKDIAIDLGDIDADGFSDLGLVGCYAVPGGRSILHVHKGGPQGLSWDSNYDQTTSMVVVQPANVYATGVGDINGDGHSDVLIGETGTSRAAVYLGGVNIWRGRPLSLAAPTGSTGFGTTAGPAGDINGDGVDDMIITDSQFAYVYLGNSSSPPTAPTTAIACGSSCQLSGFGDVNGDGLSDFVLASNLYFGTRSSAGVDPAPATLPAGNVVGVADFTNDGFADLLISQVTGAGSSVNVYTGGPAGVSAVPAATLVSPSTTGFAPGAALVADVNGDRLLDVALWGQGVRRLNVYDGTSAGLQQTIAQTLLPDGHWNLDQDFNGDGDDDIVRASGGTVRILPGSTSGVQVDPLVSLAAPMAGESSFAATVANLGDINADGTSDLGVLGQVSSGAVVHVYAGGAWGISTAPLQTITAPTGGGQFGHVLAGAGDVNGDGWADVLITDPVAGAAYVYTGFIAGLGPTPTSTLSAPTGAAGFGAAAGAVGDVNGDGFDDVVVATAQNAYLYLGSASGQVAGPSAAIACASACNVGGFGDFNGDGLSDFVLAGQVFFGQASSAGVAPAAAAAPASGAYGIADFDGDGFADLLVGLSDGSAVALFAGGASGIAAVPSVTLTSPTGPGVRFGFGEIGDINGDGWLDVALSTGDLSNDTGRVFVYPGGSGGLATTASQGIAPDVPWNLQPDFNKDGYADLVISNTNTVQIFNGSAQGLSTTPTTTLVPQLSNTSFCGGARTAGVHLGDITGDAIADLGVLECEPNGSNTFVYLFEYFGARSGFNSLGVGSSDVPFPVPSSQAAGAYVVGVGDLDADGFSDVLIGFPGVPIVRGRRGGPFGLRGNIIVNPPPGSVAFASAAGPIGDINGDGFADMVITDSQNAYVFLGSTFTAPAHLTPAAAIGCTGGCTLGGYGDINGDGLSDFIVSDNLYFGQMAPPGFGSTPVALQPAGPTAVADVNFDGAFDVLVGQPAASSASLFLSAGSGGLSPAPALTLAGPEGSGSGFGQVVDIVGDVNGDGWLDAVVWSGGSTLHIYNGSQGGFGSAPAQTFDYNANSGLSAAP
jgi:hypothetical protein